MYLKGAELAGYMIFRWQPFAQWPYGHRTFGWQVD